MKKLAQKLDRADRMGVSLFQQNNGTMNTYLVQFKDIQPVRVKAWDRSTAITKAVRERRGYRLATQVRAEVTSCKKLDVRN
jgi:hypothetical protein